MITQINQATNLKRTLYLFLQFLKRDFYIHSKQIKSYLINYVISYPLTGAFAFAYLQTNIYFGTGQARLGTMLFSGNILLVLMLITYKQTIELLFDLENNKFINYQISILHPRLVILERIIFTSLFTFALSLPYFPVAKLILWSHLDTSATSWPQLLVILYLGSLCCSAYHQLASLVLKSSSQITTLWARVNQVLLHLGGFWIPLYIVRAYSEWLGYVVYLNPLVYISEGLRQALLGGDQFLSFGQCASALIIFSVIFVLLTWRIFKKRVDHI